ncbi:DUF4442 domain-containing protein [Pseudomonas sp. D1-3]|uniref:DUF4442 domain-containing protein n=1 Tax=Phytopseudomonas argentinensis TaxID=289370 RepID=UPI0008A9A76F|nr:DUF4442 domain-containing protein [Pseudomonas argentinensis]
MTARQLARKARVLRWIMNRFRPYLGAGVWICRIAPGFRQVEVRMALRSYNRNYVGTQFGGSLYSMNDPFYLLMLMENLGRDYVVWDKTASIDFIAPGHGPAFASFAIDQAFIDQVRERTAGGDKYLPELPVEVRDGSGAPVARVNKTLYVRLKPRLGQAA